MVPVRVGFALGAVWSAALGGPRLGGPVVTAVAAVALLVVVANLGIIGGMVDGVEMPLDAVLRA